MTIVHSYQVWLQDICDPKRERYIVVDPAGLVVAAYWSMTHPEAETAANREANRLNARAEQIGYRRDG